MSDSQPRDRVNESSAPESEARDKKPGRLAAATYGAVLGIFGAVVGALLTSAFDLDLVWQATGAFLGALVMGGCWAAYLMVVFRVTGGPKGGSLGKGALWAGVSLILFVPIFAALVGGFMGAVAPNGGLLSSVQFAGIMAAVVLAAVLFGFAIGVPLVLLLRKHRKTVPRPVRAAFFGALLGCLLGSELWRAWFEVGWLNLGIPVVGILMAFAFFIMDRQTSKGTEGS